MLLLLTQNPHLDVLVDVPAGGEQMQNVARHTSALVKKQTQLGHTMFDFGVAFTLLAKVGDVC